MLAEGESKIVLYWERIEQCATLERDPNGTSYRSQFHLRAAGDVDSFHEDGTGTRAFKPENLTQKRALSRPAPSYQTQRLSRLDLQIQAVEHTATVVLDNEITNGDDCH